MNEGVSESQVLESQGSYCVFFMAMIQRISQDHQAPFCLVLVLLGNQSVTQGENKLPYAQYTLDLGLPEFGCPIFLEIQNSWGKVMERSGLIFEHFCLKVV